MKESIFLQEVMTWSSPQRYRKWPCLPW